jgi:hypothetical protein
MKLRRLIQIARRGQSLPKGTVLRHSKIAPPMTGSGAGDVRCTMIPFAHARASDWDFFVFAATHHLYKLTAEPS